MAYSYAINSPESRAHLRSGVLGYMFDFTEIKEGGEKTHESFVKEALNPNLLDELDAFNNGLG